jgi:hypothetical protein
MTLFVTHPNAQGALAALIAAKTVMFDAAAPAVDPAIAGAAAAAFTVREIKLNAVAAVQEWAGMDASELDDGEGTGDRLIALCIGIADANMDGEIGPDEADVAQSAMDEAYAYLRSKGVADEDLDAIFNSDSAEACNSAADRAKDFVASTMTAVDDDSMDDLNAFVFSEADEEPALDAAYRRVVAIRQGKKTFVKKRISGTVRLTAKQKMGIRKAGMKAHSATARMRRAKSMRLSRSMGL